MRLLLDAHFDPAVARALRDQGHDVVSAVDLGRDISQASDDELLAFAGTERRALVTRNIRDFALLHTLRVAQDRSHPGIVLVHARSFPEGDRGAEVRALARLLRSHPAPESLADTVTWLSPAP